jgi:hypothetical protein
MSRIRLLPASSSRLPLTLPAVLLPHAPRLSLSPLT